MNREVWLKADDTVGDWNERRRRITAGLEAGVDWVLVDERDVHRVRELGDIRVAAFLREGEAVDDHSGGAHIENVEANAADAMVVGKDGEGDGTVGLPINQESLMEEALSDDANAAYIHILGEEYETFAERVASMADYTIVIGENWNIIPLENLIASVGASTNIVAGVESADEAETAFETLDIGADAVLLDTDDPDEIRETVSVRNEADREQLDLMTATVVNVEQAGTADRVCIDTGSIMADDEGMLIGSMARGLFLVAAETAESPYVESRPFRVNAGAVHAYVRVPGGETKYLSELSSGDEILVVNADGLTRRAIVGRVKIERRPMFRIEAETDDGDTVGILLQNAETVKVATPTGRMAVTDLTAGDELLLYQDRAGRHFGEPVEERIIER